MADHDLCTCKHTRWMHGNRIWKRGEGWNGCRAYASPNPRDFCTCAEFEEARHAN
jgi:hypothetical protein